MWLSLGVRRNFPFAITSPVVATWSSPRALLFSARPWLRCTYGLSVQDEYLFCHIGPHHTL